MMSKFKDYTDGIDALEYCLSGELETLIRKGWLYEKLSEELGCPLEVVIKALKDGIIINKDGYVNTAYENEEFNQEEDIYYDCLQLYSGRNDYYLEDINHPYGDEECGDIGCCVKLKDYQKTWFLKGEKNETKETN